MRKKGRIPKKTLPIENIESILTGLEARPVRIRWSKKLNRHYLFFESTIETKDFDII